MNFENKLSYRLIKFFYYMQIFLSVPISIGVYYSTLNNSQNSTSLSVLCGVIIFAALLGFANIITEAILHIAYGKNTLWDQMNIFKKVIIRIKNNGKKASLLCEPMDIATYATHEFFREKSGGSILLQWKPKNLILPKDIEKSNTAFYATIGYMFYIYVLLVRNKFGEQISSIVKQYIVSLLNVPAMNKEIEAGKKIASCLLAVEEIIKRDLKGLAEVDTLVDDVHFEYRITTAFLSEFPDSPKFIPDEKRRGMTYGEISNNNTQEYGVSILECLFHGKRIVIEEFKKLIQAIQFKPHSITGLNMHEEIAWSKNPGCFEKHLKRKYNNPIFSPTDRKITQKEADLAREKDNKNAQEFYNQMKAWSNIKGTKNQDDFDVNEDSNEADRLIMLGLKTGGKSLQLVSTIKEYQKQMSNERKKILEKNNNEEELNKFITFNGIKEKINCMLYNEFIQQVEMQGSPIKNDLAESILSEDAETIKIFIFMVIRHNREMRFRYEMIDVIKKMLDRNENASVPHEKLELFGLMVSNGMTWSTRPGCFETHLQRKFNNPIFHPSKRIITQQEINLARERDLNELNELTKKVENIRKLNEQFLSNTTIGQLNKLREEIDAAIEKIYAIGGKSLDFIGELSSIRKVLIERLKQGVIALGDARALQGINDGEKFYHLNAEQFYHVFLAQLMRADSPIQPEFFETLLSETDDNIQLYLNVVKNDDIKNLQLGIGPVLDDMKSRNEDVSMLTGKIGLLGVAI